MLWNESHYYKMIFTLKTRQFESALFNTNKRHCCMVSISPTVFPYLGFWSIFLYSQLWLALYLNFSGNILLHKTTTSSQWTTYVTLNVCAKAALTFWVKLTTQSRSGQLQESILPNFNFSVFPNFAVKLECM